jgi:hypothetical protein
VTAAFLLLSRAGDGEKPAWYGFAGLGLMCCVVALPFVAYDFVLGRGDSPPPD